MCITLCLKLFIVVVEHILRITLFCLVKKNRNASLDIIHMSFWQNGQSSSMRCHIHIINLETGTKSENKIDVLFSLLYILHYPSQPKIINTLMGVSGILERRDKIETKQQQHSTKAKYIQISNLPFMRCLIRINTYCCINC